MPHPPEQKQSTHERILEAAGGLFRQKGFLTTSVDTVMRAAGLTVGGFYAHFGSKQALLIESLQRIMSRQRVDWPQGLEDLKGAEWLNHLVRRYLSRAHRDAPVPPCALPAVLSDVVRGEAELKQALAEELNLTVESFTPHLSSDERATARERALATYALCVGALTLAKATAGSPISDEVLKAARRVAMLSAEDSRVAEKSDPKK
ncbi:TetR/AcrR family transcriptional regulator [Myxococcus sp. MISCRS1]|jgi:TetR/AcrR family transcriptional repressor of nem operon|uniref:TetR/AcrR family transcriptional regulator n=1 Tax=Myxococcus TaxID=32 RepID=UPI001CBDFCDD|nr:MULTISPECIES: TetR/AcrR family transcriptional regulator [unclassified Myxococcus]MBZ4394846.1 TetR/AcrR family transcriptional regulator [Myxococcus sp. AS-1-15]MBZ4406627.1 TetR/AcrR family transcriptional regulator [Myxococcus sp. XM-1-1-1]MCY1001819.1 TetR/AcrR family transcriptional regulator [Myxococcus sp. MISCRS1]BDT36611.1 TetR/AcrR family transcriptional regulator [Myxococcus sp. MH1]